MIKKLIAIWLMPFIAILVAIYMTTEGNKVDHYLSDEPTHYFPREYVPNYEPDYSFAISDSKEEYYYLEPI